MASVLLMSGSPYRWFASYLLWSPSNKPALVGKVAKKPFWIIATDNIYLLQKVQNGESTTYSPRCAENTFETAKEKRHFSVAKTGLPNYCTSSTGSPENYELACPIRLGV